LRHEPGHRSPLAARPACPIGGEGFSDEDLAEALDAMRRGESLEAMAFRRLAQFTPSPSNDVTHNGAQVEQLRMIREYLDAERAKDLGLAEVAHRKPGALPTIHRMLSPKRPLPIHILKTAKREGRKVR
jgi:hypothetical protein